MTSFIDPKSAPESAPKHRMARRPVSRWKLALSIFALLGLAAQLLLRSVNAELWLTVFTPPWWLTVAVAVFMVLSVAVAGVRRGWWR